MTVLLHRRFTIGAPQVGVTSVNGQTGVVVLTAADVGAVPTPLPAVVSQEAAQVGQQLITMPVSGQVLASAFADGLFAACLVYAPGAMTIDHLGVVLSAAATLPVANSKLGIYDEAGTLLAATADIAAGLATPGHVEGALAAPLALTAGRYYIALNLHATTGPTVASCGQGSFNLRPISGHYPSVFITGTPDMPPSFVPSLASQNSVVYLFTAR